MTPDRRQSVTGLALAVLVVSAWLSLHVYAVFLFVPEAGNWPLALLAVALLCWLNVGLFIVAHDCMHGSLAPGLPWINTGVGSLCVALYAAFSYNRLYSKHHEHHRHSGTDRDPDFNPRDPRRFLPWYFAFFTEYFSLREFAILTVILVLYVWGLGAAITNVLAFWALPAILSSMQLFYFGTYLPHRVTARPFPDRHRARSNEYSWVISLMTCFHFGYHHEHHEHPGVPWWRLPQVRAGDSPAGAD